MWEMPNRSTSAPTAYYLVVRQIDRAHTALTEQAFHAIARTEVD